MIRQHDNKPIFREVAFKETMIPIQNNVLSLKMYDQKTNTKPLYKRKCIMVNGKCGMI